VFNYALKKGQKHAKDISRYSQLCRHCHMSQDFGIPKSKIDAGYEDCNPVGLGVSRIFTFRLHKKHDDIIKKSSKLMGWTPTKFIRWAIESSELFIWEEINSTLRERKQ